MISMRKQASCQEQKKSGEEGIFPRRDGNIDLFSPETCVKFGGFGYEIFPHRSAILKQKNQFISLRFLLTPKN